MNKNLIKKEYVIQANKDDYWYDYIRYNKKASALKAIKVLNPDLDGRFRLIFCKSFLVLDNVKKETAQATPKTITFGKWKKPLTWTVIDEDDEKMLLLCDTCVEFKRFDGYSNDYASSEIRSWLNNKDSTYNTSKEDYTNIGFLNAFTENDKRMCFSMYGYDYVGLLTVSEYEKYKERIPGVDAPWWLRSHGGSTFDAANVYLNGVVYASGSNVDDDDLGVRPALWLKKDWLKKEQNKEVTC